MRCRYCENILSNSTGRDLAVYDRVLFESENFVVVPTVGSLVEGWVLIITKEHHIRMASLEIDLLKELDRLKAEVARVIESCYGPVAIFEHGPSKPNQAIGCGVDHAHIHIVPTSCGLIPSLRDLTSQNLDWIELDGVTGLRPYRDSDQEYLLVEQPIGDVRIAMNQGFGSQLFRRVIARHLGEPSRYDWKSWRGIENVVGTVGRLTSRHDCASATVAGSGRESR